MFRKLLLALVIVIAGAGASTAQAHIGWRGHGVFRHHGWGGGWGGYRHWGGYRPWGGWGYRNWGYAGYRPWGWGWGGYRRGFYGYNSWPVYANYYYPSYSWPVYSYGGYYPYYSYPYSNCYCGNYGYTTVGYSPVFVDSGINNPINSIDVSSLLAEVSRREPLAGNILDIARRIRATEQPATVARMEYASRSAPEAFGIREAKLTLAARDPEKLIALGDDSFRAGRYREALSRYDDATERAPKLAETYFRQGHALVALKRYDEAALAFRRGVDVGGDVKRPGFRLDSLYGSKADANAHIENLAAHVLEKNDAPAYFLLGMTLRYSADVAKSDKFFKRAAELSTDPTYLAGFLPSSAPVRDIPVSRPTDEI